MGFINDNGTKRKSGEDTTKNFVGAESGETFAQRMADLRARHEAEGTGVAVIGEAYQSHKYREAPGQEYTYEAVYGLEDWSTIVEGDPSVRDVLAEIYGDSNRSADESSDIDPTQLQVIYGKPKFNAPTPKERRDSLRRAQDGETVVQDEDTRGIRGVDDDAALLESVV